MYSCNLVKTKKSCTMTIMLVFRNILRTIQKFLHKSIFFMLQLSATTKPVNNIVFYKWVKLHHPTSTNAMHNSLL